MINGEILNICSAFSLDGNPVDCISYGTGHINSTMLVQTDTGARYILQQINNGIFRDVDGLMNNIVSVTSHVIKKRIASGGDPSRCSLRFLPSYDGKYYTCRGGKYFRMYGYVGDAVSYDVADDPGLTRLLGSAVGEFQQALGDFDASGLVETIPDFHNTEKRYRDFEQAVAADVTGRARDVAEEIEFVRSRREMYGRVVDMIAAGELPLRVTHNDTKLNNVLFDSESGKVLCVIDLDTVMPGSVLYDIGDAVRFCAASAEEDERDLERMFFRLENYRGFCEGFLSSCGDSLTEKEKELIPFSCRLMTIECGMRFLTDHINGDTYFHITREGQNLDRARTQFKLVSDMEKRDREMKKVIDDILA